MLKQMAPVDLQRNVMGYEHPALVQRLEEKLGIQREEAVELFNDTKRFLFLCGTVPVPIAPPERIDECWHHFILYTQDYTEFCNSFFGCFIHHVPKSPEEVALSDGSIIHTTFQHAHRIFGERLSENWRYSEGADCDKCNPSTNCQPKPTCAKPACEKSSEVST